MIPCTNYACPRAGWCKRISYPFSEAERKECGAFMECGDFNDWINYVRNKAREIYERENPDDAFSNDKPKQKEHTNNNREPRVREDDEADSRTGQVNTGWRIIEPTSGVQLQRSSDRRNSIPGIGITWGDYIDDFIQCLQTEQNNEEGPTVFQDTSRNGVSSTWAIFSEPNDEPASTPVRETGTDSDVGGAAPSQWYILSDAEGGQDTPHN